MARDVAAVILAIILSLPPLAQAQSGESPPDSQVTAYGTPLRGTVYHLSRDQLRSLPSRDVEAFYSIFPGVSTLNDEVHVRGGRPVETDYRVEGVSVRPVAGAGDVGMVIPEALDALQLHVGAYGVGAGGANAGIVRHVLRTGGPSFEATAQYETDAATGWLDPGYGYDAHDLVATLGGPLLTPRLRFFGALDYRRTDNYWRTYWGGVDLGTPVGEYRGQGAGTAPGPIAWGDGELPGVGRPQERLRVNATVDLDLAPFRFRAVYAERDETYRVNPVPVRTMFNAARVPQRDQRSRLVSLRGSYELTDAVRLHARAGYFADAWEIYDPLFGPPEADGAGGAVLDLLRYYDREAVREALGGETAQAEAYTRSWSGRYRPPRPFETNSFLFGLPGDVTTGYQRRGQRFWELDASAEARVGRHRLAVGGSHRRWRVRQYAADATRIADRVAQDASYIDEVRRENEAVGRLLRETYIGWGRRYDVLPGGIGYDLFMNEVDSGPDAPRRPTTTSLFVEDRVALGTFRISAGLRYDRFDMGLLEPEDPGAPDYDYPERELDGLEKAAAAHVLQPRAAVEAAHGATKVRVQAGRYAQMPDMAYAYRPRSFVAGIVFSGQYFINDPFAWSLKPVVTDQVELAVEHRWPQWLTVEVATFLRATHNQLGVALQEVDPSWSNAVDYIRYVSNGSSRVLGAEVSVQTRRWRNWRALVHYALTDARGRDSRPNEQVYEIERYKPMREDLRPLAYVHRHWATAALDYQTGRTGATLTEHWTGGLHLTLRSGHPYTRGRGSVGGTSGPSDGMILSERDPRGNQFLEPINASVTPWVFNLDVRLEKGFHAGPATATAFVYVQNVFNTRHVQHVYGWTGEADDDGFLGNDSPFSHLIERESWGPDFPRFYEALNLRNRQHFVRDRGYDLYGEPRAVRVGVRIDV